jgi:hypothetical protein
MKNGQIAQSDDKVVFTSGDESFTVRDLIDWAAFQGELEPLWKKLLRLVAAEARANASDGELDDSAIAAAANSFRYEHNLLTAEETERWLDQRGLTLNDFSNYFVRQYWGKKIDEATAEETEYRSAPDELKELFVAELILSGEMDRLAKRLSWRVAGRLESRNKPATAEGIARERNRFFARNETNEEKLSDWLKKADRDKDWFTNAITMEALHRQKREKVLSKQARENETAAMRLPLTRFKLETMEVASLDVAREALLCVREDGMSLAQVAEEAHVPYQRTEVLLEELPELLRQKFLSVSAGDVLEPIARADRYQICRVVEKIEPESEDETVRDRAERRILERHFADLTAKHIHWHNVLEATG